MSETRKSGHGNAPEQSIAIDYANEAGIPAEEYISVLERSGLAERRPTENVDLYVTMLAASPIILTARSVDDDGLLVGVSRCLTDFGTTCYCADLAVDRRFQRQGIAENLLRRSWALSGEHSSFHLISAPGAVGYYTQLPMQRIPDAFWWPRLDYIDQ